jgi:hypothetical protein
MLTQMESINPTIFAGRIMSPAQAKSDVTMRGLPKGQESILKVNYVVVDAR